jgi:hypothetical protein
MDSGAATLACNNASGVGRAGTETLKVDGNVVSTQKARCPCPNPVYHGQYRRARRHTRG